jgi:hypothetical protein
MDETVDSFVSYIMRSIVIYTGHTLLLLIPWLYSSWRTLAASHMGGRFLKLYRHLVGLLGRVINPSQGLYLHRTARHRKTRTNIHALSGIQTRD